MALETSRLPFSASGPFVVRARHFKFAGRPYDVGEDFPASDLTEQQANEYERLLTPRRLESLYNGRFIDVKHTMGRVETVDEGFTFDPDVNDLQNPSKGPYAGRFFVTKSRKKVLEVTPQEYERLSKVRKPSRVRPSGTITED